jgi:hypothetical protein
MVQLGTHFKVVRAHAAQQCEVGAAVVRLQIFRGVCAKGIYFRVELQKCNSQIQ